MRRLLLEDGTTMQQAMIGEGHRYGTEACNQLMVGVVLDVQQADNVLNRSSWQRGDRRGVRHEATVLVIDDGTGAYTLLRNVAILPWGPSGIDSYTESLPRPTTKTVTSQEYNTQLHQIDVQTLDGDYCVVGFIGGRMTNPVMLSWFPHPRNTVDPATSGHGNPNSSGQGTTLVQLRHFQRMYGVEHLITQAGDVYLSTQLAGGAVNPTSDLVAGRFARDVPDLGGAIFIDVKPNQLLEINFNPIVEGTNLFGWDDALPQTNPRGNGQSGTREDTRTIVHADENLVSLKTPEEIELVTDTLTVEAPTTSVSCENFTVDASSSCAIISDNINLGDSSLTPQDTVLRSSFATNTSLLSALASAASAASTASSSPTPTNIAAATTALNAALVALVSALSGSQTTKTKAS